MSNPHARRRRWIAGGILAALGLAAAWGISRIPPRGELAARVLSTWLRRPVTIASVELRFRSGIDVELEGVRVAASASANPEDPPVFEVRRARARQSWPRVLAGQLVPVSWELVDPVVRIGPRTAAPGSDGVAIPELDLSVSGGRVEWQREGEPALIAQEISIEARRGALGSAARGRAAGTLYAGDTQLCSLDVDFEGWLDQGRVEGSVESLDLSQLPLGGLRLAGLATGRFALRRDGNETGVDVDADVVRLALPLPGKDTLLRPAQTRVEAAASWREGTLALDLRRVRLDDIDASGKISVDPRPEGRTRGELSLADFTPGPRERLHPVHVLAVFARSWEKRNEQMLAGQIRDASLGWDLPTARFGERLAFEEPSADDELEIRLRAENGVYRTGETGEPLRDISGELVIRGNTLEVSKLRIRKDGEWLPELEIRIDGMTRLAHLPEPERDLDSRPGIPPPGLGPLMRELSQDDSGPGGPRVVRLRNVDLYYPPALLPVRDGRGRLTQEGDRIDVKLERAVVGGVEASADVGWDATAKRLSVDLRYRGGDVPPRAPAPHWLAASVEIDQLSVGGWTFADVGGRVSVVGDRAELGSLRGRLAGGPVTARGELALGKPDAAGYWLEFEVSGADASQLAPRIDLQPQDVAGTLTGKGRLEGRLAPEESFLASARLTSDLELRDGHLGGLPALIAIARLPSLRGARALLGRPLVFRTTTGHVSISDGALTLSDARLDGPELRLIADGELQLRDPGRERDILITLLFLRTVDGLISQVPFLGRFVLGKDEALVGASFRVQGPRDQTRVTPVPPEMLTNATAWATGVISSGARRLGRMIRILPPADPEKEERDDASAADTRTPTDPGPP
jgi:hypothetical protein